MAPQILPVPRPRSLAALRGWRLALARGLWGLGAAGALALFLAYLPFNAQTVQEDVRVQSAAVAVAPQVFFGAFTGYVVALHYLTAAVSFVVAALIVWRKSDEAVALLVALGLLLLPNALFSGEGSRLIYAHYGPPWHAWLPLWRNGLATLALLYLPFLLYIFPTGRCEPRWMRWPAWGGGLGLIGLMMGNLQGWVAWEAAGLAYLLWLALALGAQLYRFLRLSSAAERQQTRWFVVAISLIPVWMLVNVFGIAGLSEAEGNLLNLHLQTAVVALIPVGVGLGVLRRGLWGADPIINRTLVYGALTLSVIGLYVLIVGGLSALLQSSGSVLLSALVTGAVAFLFQPLRQRLQRLINRLMYGDRDDPATALAQLGQRLKTAASPETLLLSIVETVAQTLRVPYAAITVRREQSAEMQAEWRSEAVLPGAPLVTTALPLVFQSETLGHLRVAPRAPEEPFSAADQRLLEQIAQQAAPAVHAYRLTADLQRSREKIVTAREEERRRLRRDLHDELGPTLASHALKLEAALEALEPHQTRARAQLQELKTQTQTLVSDVRRLVYDLRPPVLDELGLVSAVREHAQRLAPPASRLQVRVSAPDALPPLSAAVEAAAYRIAVEACTNVIKHARAHDCALEFSSPPGEARRYLRLTITDDGVGLPAQHQAGAGFASMRERAEELGGTCSIHPRAPHGVQVVAQLPLSAPPA